MNKTLYSLNETIELINQGKLLILAGDEKLLSQLPQGNWIAGTTPYFISTNGGITTKEQIFVTDLTDVIENFTIKTYDISSLKNVYKDGLNNGFSVIILPANSDIQLSFSINAPDYKDFAVRPLVGWISGHIFGDNNAQAKVFWQNGNNCNNNLAVVMHISLPKNKFADVNLFNIYTQGDGDKIEFLETGFEVKDALINGNKQNFAEYIRKNNIDSNYPLVADYNSVMINSSIYSVENEIVKVFAPVFRGQEYRFAKKIDNFDNAFNSVIPNNNNVPCFSCVCILYFLLAKLEGKKLGNIFAPVTFGEICYQLVNQTIVTVSVNNL